MTNIAYARIQRPSKLQKVSDIDSVSQLKKLLLENLNMCGVNSLRSTILSNIIIGAYLSKMSILFYGKNSNSLVNAISAVLSGRVPAILEFKSGFDEYGRILEAINEQTGEIVVLHNAVGSLPESVYLHLAEDVPEKYFLYSADSANLLQYLPSGILSYIVLVSCDDFVNTKMRVTTPFNAGIFKNTINCKTYSPDKFKEMYESVKMLSQYAQTENGYIVSRMKLLIVLNTLNISRGKHINILLPELMFYSRLNRRNNEFLNHLHNEGDADAYEIGRLFNE